MPPAAVGLVRRRFLPKYYCPPQWVEPQGSDGGGGGVAVGASSPLRPNKAPENTSNVGMSRIQSGGSLSMEPSESLQRHLPRRASAGAAETMEENNDHEERTQDWEVSPRPSMDKVKRPFEGGVGDGGGGARAEKELAVAGAGAAGAAVDVDGARPQGQELMNDFLTGSRRKSKEASRWDSSSGTNRRRSRSRDGGGRGWGEGGGGGGGNGSGSGGSGGGGGSGSGGGGSGGSSSGGGGSGSGGGGGNFAAGERVASEDYKSNCEGVSDIEQGRHSPGPAVPSDGADIESVSRDHLFPGNHHPHFQPILASAADVQWVVGPDG